MARMVKKFIPNNRDKGKEEMSRRALISIATTLFIFPEAMGRDFLSG